MAMLLDRAEMSFDFGGARLDPVRDRQLVEWIMNQFLYGEMTGIQVGHWLYAAPDVAAARFLARQSLEEMQHVDNFLRMLRMMGMQAKPAHPMVRFLSTGMMGGSWAEHVCLEMAAGEGFVLVAFYAVIDALDHQPSVDILRRAVKQEERHVEFGEQQTMRAIQGSAGLRRRLTGLHMVSLWGVTRLGRFIQKRLPQDHPVLRHMPAFLAHTNRCAELRMQRMGLIDRPLADIPAARKALYIAEAYGFKLPRMLLSAALLPFRLLARPFRRRKRLTETYLDDPYVRGFAASTPPAEAADAESAADLADASADDRAA
ncbi:MAG TPA: ferritin-like domain-containing protein [Kofleriaceae bacterium]|nr:ferritin-like domain-containing protein [Kofleriaceae bacterium]